MLTFAIDTSTQYAYYVRMELKLYLQKAKKESGINHQDFANKAAISKGYLQEILALKKCPTPKIAKKIQTASGGVVTALEVVQPFYSNSYRRPRK